MRRLRGNVQLAAIWAAILSGVAACQPNDSDRPQRLVSRSTPKVMGALPAEIVEKAIAKQKSRALRCDHTNDVPSPLEYGVHSYSEAANALADGNPEYAIQLLEGFIHWVSREQPPDYNDLVLAADLLASTYRTLGDDECERYWEAGAWQFRLLREPMLGLNAADAVNVPYPPSPANDDPG